MAALLGLFTKRTYSGEPASDCDNLAHHFDVFVMAELDGAMEMLRIWMDHQRAVLDTAACAQVLPVALQKQIYRLFPNRL
jgi:hypothetical protein